jgi:hypothetical protein
MFWMEKQIEASNFVLKQAMDEANRRLWAERVVRAV